MGGDWLRWIGGWGVGGLAGWLTVMLACGGRTSQAEPGRRGPEQEPPEPAAAPGGQAVTPARPPVAARLPARPPVAEPAWVQQFTVPPTSGPPQTGCATLAEAGPPPASARPKAETGGSAGGPVDFDLKAMPQISVSAAALAPGSAVNAAVDPAVLRAALSPPDLGQVEMEALRGAPEDILRVQRVLARVGAPTRIGFWGASHVAGEYFTGHIRRVLQERHGDGGHGFVMPAPPWKGYRAADLNLCSGGKWSSDYDRRSGGRGDGMFGPGGISVESADPAAFGWVQTTKENPQGRTVARFEVLFLRQPGGGRLRLTVDDAAPVEVSTGSPEGGGYGPGAAILHVAPGQHRLTLAPAGDGPVRILGVNLEAAEPGAAQGVVVDAMGVNGRTASSWLRWDKAQLQQWFSRRPYDLIVLAYGTNEGNDASMTPEVYRKTLESVLVRVRELMPETPCVLVGPGDRAKKLQTDLYAIWSPNAAVARVQAEVGPRYGCATWDTLSAMGGEGSSLSWARAVPPLMSSDMIHLSGAGYKLLGEQFIRLIDGS